MQPVCGACFKQSHGQRPWVIGVCIRSHKDLEPPTPSGRDETYRISARPLAQLPWDSVLRKSILPCVAGVLAPSPPPQGTETSDETRFLRLTRCDELFSFCCQGPSPAWACLVRPGLGMKKSPARQAQGAASSRCRAPGADMGRFSTRIRCGRGSLSPFASTVSKA